jgi:hypothetical protein
LESATEYGKSLVISRFQIFASSRFMNLDRDFFNTTARKSESTKMKVLCPTADTALRLRDRRGGVSASGGLAFFFRNSYTASNLATLFRRATEVWSSLSPEMPTISAESGSFSRFLRWSPSLPMPMFRGATTMPYTRFSKVT